MLNTLVGDNDLIWLYFFLFPEKPGQLFFRTPSKKKKKMNFYIFNIIVIVLYHYSLNYEARSTGHHE